uniref:fish-egg lectin-like n=1 Tax=Pristiophorus japonicus TaxID=55135 RepID=UPI00398F74CE
MRGYIFLLLLLVAASQALICRRIAGNLKQIDASNGQVYGVSRGGKIFTRSGQRWLIVPGRMSHVTVGADGVWAVGRRQTLYRMIGGTWAMLAGELKQVDAGGDQIVVGVDANNNIFCANKRDAVLAANYSGPAYKQVDGKLKYYSCGPQNCWGVNAAGTTYCRVHVSPVFCAGTHWQKVDGKLAMVEVGTDGAVYGVGRDGMVYRRDGITSNEPQGTQWTRIHIVGGRFSHLSSDLGALWLIETDGSIVHCR